MYVEYGYYDEEYGGMIPEHEFPSAERKAEAYIRCLTYVRGDVFAIDDNAIKNAVCAVADVYHAFAMRKQNSENGPLKSENNDGYSVNYVTEQTDGQTEEELIQKKAYEAAYTYLLPTGWLSRKVGCDCDHKCSYLFL